MFTQNNDGLALSIFKIYEPNQTKIVKKYVHEGDVVIDVGAHVGYYTLLMAQLVGKNGKVYSFEPDPVNFELLKKSVEINGFENVVLIQKAVSDTTEKIKLFLGDNDSAINRIYDAKLGDAKKSIDVEIQEFAAEMQVQLEEKKMQIQQALQSGEIIPDRAELELEKAEKNHSRDSEKMIKAIVFRA